MEETYQIVFSPGVDKLDAYNFLLGLLGGSGRNIGTSMGTTTLGWLTFDGGMYENFVREIRSDSRVATWGPAY